MRLTFKWLKYIFYRAYVWQGNIQANENRRVLTALAHVSILLGFYLLALMAAIEDFFKVSLFSSSKRIGIIFAVLFGLLFYVVPYLFLIHAEYYKKIIAEMATLHETKYQSRVREILIFLNYVVAFILLIFFAALPHFTLKSR